MATKAVKRTTRQSPSTYKKFPPPEQLQLELPMPPPPPPEPEQQLPAACRRCLAAAYGS
jgi:hypothetical protein